MLLDARWCCRDVSGAGTDMDVKTQQMTKMLIDRQLVNVVANFVGASLNVVIPLAFNVIYYRALGSESYGLIGWYGSLLLLGSMLDMGLNQTSVREFARRAADPERRIELRPVLFTLQTVYVCLGISFGLIIILCSGWLARSWLNAGKLAVRDVSVSIAIMGGMIACWFPTVVFHAFLLGLQRQVLRNTLSVLGVASRGLTAVGALILFGAVPIVFFTAQLSVCVAEVITLGVIAWSMLPGPGGSLRLDGTFLLSIWRFTSANGLAVVINQIVVVGDKMILSTALPLEVFGLYSFTSTAASLIPKLAGPFTLAYYPRFVELIEQKRLDLLSHVYHFATQLLSIVLISVGSIVAIYAKEIIFLLTGSYDSAARLGPVLALLSIGNTVSALMWLPIYLQFASGVASAALNISAVQAVVCLPTLLLLVPRYGMYVAPTMWLIVNCITFPVVIRMTHHSAVKGQAWRWVKDAVAWPTCGVTGALGAGFVFSPAHISWIVTSPWLAVNCIMAIVAGMLCAPASNGFIRAHFRKWDQPSQNEASARSE
jgi:O-antigen/teichoic acid export membrane protein